MPSNTADRWWVRIAARWLARVDGVKAHIQVVSLAVTAFSTFSLVLQNSGHGWLVRPLGLGLAIILPVYTYLYTEGGVWNQVSRDRVDLSTNYAGPTMLMDDVQIAIGTFVAVHGRKPTKEERREIEAAIKEQWNGYRNGINLDDD
jgi:hypothetical protein